MRLQQTRLIAQAASLLPGRGDEARSIAASLVHGDDFESNFIATVLNHRRQFPRAYLVPLIESALQRGAGGCRRAEIAAFAYGYEPIRTAVSEARRLGALTDSAASLLLYSASMGVQKNKPRST